MILVCPSCEAKFKVPDGAITADGRKVRCAKCQHSWHATPNHALKPAAKMAAKMAAPKASTPAANPTTPRAPAQPLEHQTVQPTGNPASIAHSVAIDTDPIGEDGTADDNNAEDTHSVDTVNDIGASENDGVASDTEAEPLLDDFDSDLEDNTDKSADDLWEDVGVRRRLSKRSRLQWTRRLIMLGWVALLATVLGILGLFIFNKEGVTKAIPATHQIYDFFSSAGEGAIDKYRPDEGEPVSTPLGEIDVYVRADLYTNLTRFEEIDGKNQLAIRGFVENTGSRAAHVPQVQISIKDQNGTVLDQWLHEPVGLVLRRGQQLQFETFRYPVPAAMASVEVKALEGTRSNTEAPAR